MAGSKPDEKGPFQDNCGHVGGRSISRQNGPQEEHCSQVVDIGGCLVGAHLQHHPSFRLADSPSSSGLKHFTGTQAMSGCPGLLRAGLHVVCLPQSRGS